MLEKKDVAFPLGSGLRFMRICDTLTVKKNTEQTILDVLEVNDSV